MAAAQLSNKMLEADILSAASTVWQMQLSSPFPCEREGNAAGTLRVAALGSLSILAGHSRASGSSTCALRELTTPKSSTDDGA